MLLDCSEPPSVSELDGESVSLVLTLSEVVLPPTSSESVSTSWSLEPPVSESLSLNPSESESITSSLRANRSPTTTSTAR